MSHQRIPLSSLSEGIADVQRANPPIKIIYIMGDGRSGSTLLDAILNNADDVISIGEGYRFWERFHKAQTYCGCGTEIEKCQLWNKVHDDLKNMDSYSADLIGKKIKEVFLYRNFDSIGTDTFSRENKWFLEIVKQYYKSIARHSRKSIVVDSSKSPAWGRIISSFNEFQVYFLHIERKLPSVVSSWKKNNVLLPDYRNSIRYMPVKPSFNTVRTWLRVKVLGKKFRKMRYLHLRHEDLCQFPNEHISAISDFTQLKLDAGHLYFKKNHSVAGNPMRIFKDDVAIEINRPEGKPKNISNQAYILLTFINRLSNWLIR